MADLTDLEIVRRCAAAIRLRYSIEPISEADDEDEFMIETAPGFPYDPLHDKAQAMELVERFDMTIERERDNTFGVTLFKDAFKKGSQTFVVRQEPDLCRAICLCVARMKG